MNLNYLRYRIIKPFKSWKNKYLKYITKREAEKFDLYEKIAEEISEYTHESIETVKQKHRLGPESEKDFGIFKSQNNLTTKSVEDFYQRCNYYIYELPLWNAERNRPKYLSLIVLPYLKRNKYKKVMDFGGGAGDLCIELTNHNLEADYCDIGEQLFNFSKWRFEKRNLSLKMIKTIDDIKEDERYDCILSFDAFEHIKNLSSVLGKLVRHISINGSLIFSGAFSGGTLHLEENEKYDKFKELNKLMKNHGLIFQDRLAQFYFYKRQK